MSAAKNDLVQYRCQRAQETLEDARILANSERWNACLNRLYYACFYAVTALLLQHGLSSSKHSGVRGLFNKNFVKTGLVEKPLAETYNDLFEKRQTSDYADFAQIHAEHVRPLLPKADLFVKTIVRLVSEGCA